MGILTAFIWLSLFEFSPSNNNLDSHFITDKGVGDITIHKSTLKDVQMAYGEKKIHKTWHNSVETELLGRYEYFLEYENFAIFSTYTINRNYTVIKKIIIDSSSLCKTKNGFGIGSNYVETLKEVGIPKQSYIVKNVGKNYRLNLIYDGMDIFFNHSDSLTNEVEMIIFS